MRAATRILLAFAALCLAAGGATHAVAFPKAAMVIDGSNLSAFFASAFKGLWLSDSASLFASALAFGFIAARPGSAARPLILLLALAPLASAAMIYATMGNFFAGHLLLLASAAALLGGALHREASRAA
jgi:hypothetical protein